MIDFPIYDSHIHLLDRSRFSYSWSAAAASWASGSPRLNRDWSADDLASHSKPYQIEGFVFVEADADMPQYIDEARWIEELALSDPRIKGSVACLPLERGVQVERELETIAGLPHVRGVRRLIQNLQDDSVILAPEFLAALKLLPKYSLLFDICIIHHQFPRAIEMVRRCPDVTFVLDHIGKPNIKANLFDPWREHIKEIAKFPNVTCKLSGVLTEADHAAWKPEQLRPYIDHVIESFGVDRVMFGGDWPVLELAGCYRSWVDVVDWATSALEIAERRKIFRDNVIRIYHLSEPSQEKAGVTPARETEGSAHVPL